LVLPFWYRLIRVVLDKWPLIAVVVVVVVVVVVIVIVIVVLVVVT